MKLLIEDDEGEKSVVPFSSDEITIGRQKEGNSVCLSQRNVSRRHARLAIVNGGVYLEDLGSSNGTRVNGERIEGRRRIRIGDLIQIGAYDLAIQESEEEPKQSSEKAQPAVSPPPRAAPAAAPDIPATAAPAVEAVTPEAAHPKTPSPGRAHAVPRSPDEHTAVMAPQRLAELSAQSRQQVQAPRAAPLRDTEPSQEAAPGRLIRPSVVALLLLISALLGFAVGQVQIWMRNQAPSAPANTQTREARSSAAENDQPASVGEDGPKK